MKKLSFTFVLILALTLVAWAAEPYSNLSAIALEHLGLNAPGSEMATPYFPGGAVDNITWLPEPNCLNTINRAACGKVGNYVYIFGGQGSGSSATHVAFNITTEQWASSTAPGVGGSNWSSAATNNALYVYPRSLGNAEVQKFVPDSAGGPLGTWSLVALYPNTSASQAVAWDGGNYIYSAGGAIFTTPPTTTQAYRFNLTTNQFDSIASMPQGRAYCGGAFADGMFYVLGGDDDSYLYTNSCFEYTPATNSWATKAPLILASAFNCFNTVTDGELIYLVGGGGGNATTLPSTDTVQVYDPATDTWSIETNRMNNYGTNSAAYVPEGNYILDVGGRIMTTSYNVTWRGNLEGGGAPTLDVTITPHNPPIVIPPGGGSFMYDVEIENNTIYSIDFDAWIKAILPNGSGYMILVRLGLSLPGGSSLVREDLTQFVPPNAPAGNYAYGAYVGTYPSTVMASDTIFFTKSAADGYAGLGGDWNLDGWAEDNSLSSEIRSATASCAISPNPFNPSTTIRYDLAQASLVQFGVYDLSGRLVAELANGWREAGSHQITFDGSNLSSGIYLYRLTADDWQAMGKMVLMK